MPKSKESHQCNGGPTNATELRIMLQEQFEKVRKDPKEIRRGLVMATLAGRIMEIPKAQIEYCKLRGDEPDIPFLGKTSGRPLRQLASSPGRINLISQ